MRSTTTLTAVAVTALCSLLANPASAARPKSGRLTAMQIPGGPMAGLFGGGADANRIWAYNDAQTFWRSDDAGVHWARLGDHTRNHRWLAASPQDREVVFATDGAAGANGAVPIYRSSDAGLTFERVDDGSLRDQWTTSLAADPLSATLYASGPLGVWTSRNGGLRWSRLSSQPAQADRILPDPRRPGRLWATTTFGISKLWTSSDAGATWRAISTPLTGDVRNMALGPTGEGLAIAGMNRPWSPGDHVWWTRDDGLTWVDLGAPSGGQLDGLLFVPGPSPALWLLVNRESDTSVFELPASATTWTHLPAPHRWTGSLLALKSGQVIAATTGGLRRWAAAGAWERPLTPPAAQSVRALALASDGPPWVFVGTWYDGLWRGLVSGESWQRMDPPGGGDGGVSALAFGGQPATLYAAMNNRIFRSDCGGCSWQAADGGFDGFATAITLAVDPADANVVWALLSLAGSQIGIWRTQDGGASWALEEDGIPAGSAVNGLQIAPNGSGDVVATTGRSGPVAGGIFSWNAASQRWEQAVERDGLGLLTLGADGTRWAIGASDQEERTPLLRSLNRDESWSELSTPLHRIFDLAAVRDDASQLWAIDYAYPDNATARLWRSRDRGDHFEQLASAVDVSELAVYPDDRGVAFLGASAGLYRWNDICHADAYTLCLDGGRIRVDGSWQNRYDGSVGRARVRQQSDATGVIAFSDLANPELIVKAIDLGRPRPEIFVGQLTDLDWQVRFTDTNTGELQVITNHDGACKPPEREVTSMATDACVADARTLCLLDGRLRVRATWENQYDGSHGAAGTLPYSPLASWLTFVDPTLPELLLKALDFGDRTLLYWGALTDLGYRLTVDDLRTGLSRSYTNPPRQRCGGSDTWATPQ